MSGMKVLCVIPCLPFNQSSLSHWLVHPLASIAVYNDALYNDELHMISIDVLLLQLLSSSSAATTTIVTKTKSLSTIISL